MPAELDIVVRGGTLAVGDAEIQADVAVRDGRIVQVGELDSPPSAAKVFDARGKHVIPGAIDAHVHFNTYSEHADTLSSAMWSAAHGGITTVLCFVRGSGEVPPDVAVEHFIAEGHRDGVIDFGFHLILDPHTDLASQIEDGLQRGIRSFKMFMAYPRRGLMLDDGLLFLAMRIIAQSGSIAMLHCENGHVIDRLELDAAASARRLPADFPATRPAFAEMEAIKRGIVLAEAAACRLYIVHVSTAGGVAEITRAIARGIPVIGETCPQYLLLEDSAMESFGALAKIAPPLRSAVEREALWDGLARGTLTVIGSDHSPYTRAGKSSSDIFDVPFGAPGTETLLPLLYSEGVLRRGLPLSWLARVLSEAPARAFGLYPRKGAILPGADADLVILDPQAEWILRSDGLHSRSDYTLFEGFPMKGRPVASLLRGRPVLWNGEIVSPPGYAQYIGRPSDRTLARDAHRPK